VASLIALVQTGASCGGSAISTAEIAPVTHPALFYDDATFFSSVRAAATLPLPRGDVTGGIIPHDWRGGQYIAWLFRSLAERDPPATVILIGPNHDNEGSWRTNGCPGRLVSASSAGQRAHRRADGPGPSPPTSPLTAEHSVAGIMPAIATRQARAWCR
jgi:hypothetical protein